MHPGAIEVFDRAFADDTGFAVAALDGRLADAMRKEGFALVDIAAE